MEENKNMVQEEEQKELATVEEPKKENIIVRGAKAVTGNKHVRRAGKILLGGALIAAGFVLGSNVSGRGDDAEYDDDSIVDVDVTEVEATEE